MILLKIPLRPVSTNRLYLVSKYHKIYLSKPAREFTEKCKKMISEQYTEKPIDKPISVTFVFNLTGDKKIDIDNMLRLVINCGNKLLWEDDSLIDSVQAVRKLNQEEDNIRIVINDSN